MQATHRQYHTISAWIADAQAMGYTLQQLQLRNGLYFAYVARG